MKINKKIVLVALVTVIVLAITLGAVAITQASDQTNNQPQAANASVSANVSLFEKISAIYKANTGTAIDAAALQNAFTQAQKELATAAQDRMWQKLVDEGKITQQQLDAYKKWLAARPELNTDALKKWMESKPEGVPFGPGLLGRGMPGKMFRR
jgi:predicted PurR-regulated permease PerM